MAEQTGFLERQFGLSKHGTTVRTEFIAGLTTFLTMVYIVFVNPTILGAAGMDKGAVFVATCLAAAVSTAVMALYANYPIALAPGMGLNAFFAFTVVLGYKYTWQQALAAVFLSGVLFFLISIFRIREYIINAIPRNLKFAISAGVGLFLGIIALEQAKIVVAHPVTLVTLGPAHRHGGVAGAAVPGRLRADRRTERAQHHRRHADRHPDRLADRPAVRAGNVLRHRLAAAVAGADAAAARFLAHLRADLHHRRVLVPVHRRVRQRRHSDRRHPQSRVDRQGRQPAAHERGADFRQLCRDVWRRDRHLDDDELHRKRIRRRSRRAHRIDRAVRGAVLPAGAVLRAARRHGAGLRLLGRAVVRRLRDGAGPCRDGLGGRDRICARGGRGDRHAVDLFHRHRHRSRLHHLRAGKTRRRQARRGEARGAGAGGRCSRSSSRWGDADRRHCETRSPDERSEIRG